MTAYTFTQIVSYGPAWTLLLLAIIIVGGAVFFWRENR